MKEYNKPEINIISIMSEDVITVSVGPVDAKYQLQQQPQYKGTNFNVVEF